MSMVINHNIPALQTYNIVNSTSNSLQKSIAKLSSGLRINSAADDAAGLAISEKMRAQVRGLDRAVANTQDGISLIQTAEGALSETHSILQRMRELSVQAANDTLTQQDRSYIQEEIDQLNEEITRIGNTTQFNKKKLLNGDSAGLWSSSSLETKAIIKGGLREIDQFGQKKSVEGNYKITVKADPGQGEVQKSDIMTIKHPNVITNKTVNSPLDVKDVETEGMAPGTYSLKFNGTDAAAATAAADITGSYGIGGQLYTTTNTISAFGAIPAGGETLTIKLGETELYSQAFDAGIAGTSVATDVNTKMANMVAKAAEQGVSLSGTLAADGSGTLTTTKLGSAAPTLSFTWSNGTTSPCVPNEPTNAAVKAEDVFTVASTTKNTLNGSVLFEVKTIDSSTGIVTMKATASTLSQDGVSTTKTMDNIVVKQGGDAVNLTDIFGGTDTDGEETVTVALTNQMIGAIQDGAKFAVSIKAGVEENNDNVAHIQLTGALDGTWEDGWQNGVFNGKSPDYILDSTDLADKEIHFKNYMVNGKSGEATLGDIVLKTGGKFTTATGGAVKAANITSNDTLASFTNTYIGKTATGDVKLRDLDKFWNSEGTFMLEDAKTLTLNQGNGKTASITLYANDTLDEVATKINDAIASGLGQSKYVDDATKFATFVSGPQANSEAVNGTFVIRSVVPGAAGEITFSGDQGIIDAFSLNTIQDSKETVYNVDVSDAHTGEIIAQNVKTTGNVLHGVINENVDVEFGALSGVTAKWSEPLKAYTYTSQQTSSTLHLADNTTVLQVGANEGEDLGMDIGDMRSHALGLDGVNVMSHERAGRSITIIDNAIDKVSTQRAKLGAYQNRLEYTASNLTTASENLTSAESRIRDTDMAKEMMNFTKLNIMLQAGNSMLAQANQQPQNVLSLIR